ncbi:MAG: hypothetical protein QXT67_02225 [Candidatus Bathyarchaeia archaeon]
MPVSVGVEVLRAHIREASITASKEWIGLVVSKSLDSISTVILRVKGLESGEYLVYTDEGFSAFFSCPTGDLEVDVPVKGSEVKISVSLVPSDHKL